MPCSRFVVIRALGGDDLLRPSRAVCEKNTLSCASIVQKCLITADGTALHDEEKTSIGFCFPIPELMASIVFPAKTFPRGFHDVKAIGNNWGNRGRISCQLKTLVWERRHGSHLDVTYRWVVSSNYNKYRHMENIHRPPRERHFP